MASKKNFLRIGEIFVLLLVLLLTTSFTAKRHLFADSNDDVGIKGAKIDRQSAQDRPWGGGGYPWYPPWGGYPPATTKSKTKIKT